MKPPVWFERKFEFSFPPDFHPNLCARLRGAPARLDELAATPAGSSWTRSIPGKWSAQEHAGHLLDLEPLWIARVGDFISGAANLTAADLTNRKTHDANHNARALREIVEGFRRTRFQLMQQVETMEPSMFERVLIHPRMKVPMRLVDHLFFAAEHDDHHLAHIWALLQEN